jgi:transcriptional regulator with XRE-family HTH domain
MPVPPDAAALGRAVQAIRAEKGMSQMQLAEATGFMQSWISNVELAARAEALADEPPQAPA